jgi:hypothetical protein
VVAEPADDLPPFLADAVWAVKQFRLVDLAVPVARKLPVIVFARISSSVAIQRNPAAATSGTIASDTDPSEGQRPSGLRPNSRW